MRGSGAEPLGDSWLKYECLSKPDEILQSPLSVPPAAIYSPTGSVHLSL